MKKIIAAIILIAVILPVSVLGQSGQPTQETDSPNNIMIVIYLIPDGEYVTSYVHESTATVREHEGKLYRNGFIIINDLTRAGWGFFKYRLIDRIYELDEYGDRIEIPQTITELDLEPVGVGDLPHSQHIAKIKSICLDCARPVTVTRKWMGELYDIDCLVSQSIVELYQMGKVAVGDYVIVSFIDENPDNQEINIPVVVDRIYPSW